MFTKTVVGYDASAEAQDALALAGALVPEDAELLLCCVHPLQPVSAAVVAGEHDVPGRDEAMRRLDEGAERLGGRRGVRTIALSATSAASGLHAVAAEEDAELLVVGSSHRGALGRVLLGSTTSQVLTAAPCAVAVAPAGLREAEPAALRRIAVAFDGGREARHAAAIAAALARAHGARLRLLTVVEPLADALGWSGAYVYPEYREDALRIAREELDGMVEELGDDVRLEADVVEGRPTAELVLASSTSDLLVMGSRGYGPVRRVLLGAVSARVAGAAASPVLVVPRVGEQG